jgi:hypothetical protein
MLTNDFQAQPTNKVIIYGPKDNVPETAKAIGQVTVDGKNTSLRKQYTRAIDLAVKETARKGGNVLVVDNRELKENRMKGTIAYTNEKIIDSLTLSAYRVSQLQHMPLSKKPTDVKQMDEKEQQEIAQQQEAARQQEMERQQRIYTRQDSLQWAGATDVDWDKDNKDRGGMFKISAGPMWTTSKIYLTADASQYLSNQRGYGIALSLTNTGGKLYGFGADFYASRTSLDIPETFHVRDCNYTLMYLGPCALIGGNLTNWLRLDASLGLGLAYYQEDGQTEETEFGFGFRWTIGMEIMVNKTTGIGVDMVRQIGRFKRPEGFQQPKGEAYGIENLGVMLTARFHM